MLVLCFPILFEKYFFERAFPPQSCQRVRVWVSPTGSSIESHTLVGISVNRNYLEACDRCNLVSADTASLASPAMSVSRESVSKNVPAALAKLMRLAP